MKKNISPEVDIMCQRLIDQLKDEREKQDISTYRLSEKTGILQGNITRMETYEAYPGLATVMKILNALGMDFKIVSKKLTTKNSPKEADY